MTALTEPAPRKLSKKDQKAHDARLHREERRRLKKLPENKNFPFTPAKTVQPLIVTDREKITVPCEAVSLKEGLEIVAQLYAALDKHNKKASKPLTKEEYARGVRRPPKGIGLAANQIGINKRVCVIRLPKLSYALVNPRITAYSKGRFPYEEGCLSLPGQNKIAFRHYWVTVEADNLKEPITVGVQDPGSLTSDKMLEAACLQHEIAHTYGLIVDDFTTEDYPTPDTWGRFEAYRAAQLEAAARADIQAVVESEEVAAE